MTEVDIDPRGSVYVSSIIHVPHAQFGAPYQVGYIDLPDGPRVFGHFDQAEVLVPIGVPVEVTTSEVQSGEGKSSRTTTLVRFQLVNEVSQ
jgi:uncharacterized OB-fold protein